MYIFAQTDARGQQQGKGGTYPSSISDEGRSLLKELMRDGFGDHILLLKLYQAWASSGYNHEWCKSMGVDQRSMRFARDIRNQLERIVGIDGRGLDANTARKDDDDKKSNDKDEGRHKDKKQRRSSHGGFSDSAAIKSLRMALTIGFANRMARRMPMHNGYRTLGAKPALAQVCFSPWSGLNVAPFLSKHAYD